MEKIDKIISQSFTNKGIKKLYSLAYMFFGRGMGESSF
jgi:hypothetical protein